MKSKLRYLFIGAFAMTMTSCETENVSDSNTTARQMAPTANSAVVNELTPCASSELLAAQRYDAGDIKVYFDAQNVYVEYQTSANWHLRKTHLFVGDQRLVPITRLGAPNYEFFPINETHPEGAESAIYSISKANLPKCFIITAYAEVYRTESNGEIVQIEAAWSEGNRFDSESWGMFFNVCQSDCSN
ncbi:MAG: hypothetical protein KAX93_02610 [Flavobacterium sp.]|nr:hypothetical protein [Flavobacterium sp.]